MLLNTPRIHPSSHTACRNAAGGPREGKGGQLLGRPGPPTHSHPLSHLGTQSVFSRHHHLRIQSAAPLSRSIWINQAKQSTFRLARAFATSTQPQPSESPVDSEVLVSAREPEKVVENILDPHASQANVPQHLLDLTKKISERTGASMFFRIQPEEDDLKVDKSATEDKGYKVSDLVRLTETQHPETPEILQTLVKLCATNPMYIAEVAQANGVKILQKLLRDTNEDIKVSAAQLVGLLATNASIRRDISTSDVVSIICKGFLGNPDEVLARSYLAALRNVANDRQAIYEIMDSGALVKLVKVLDSQDDKMVEQAAGALMNMANNDETRVAICQHGAVEKLAQLLEYDQIPILRTTTAALANIGSTNPTIADYFTDGAVAVLSNLLKRVDAVDIQDNVAIIMQYLGLKLKHRIKIRNSGGITTVVRILERRKAQGSPKATLLATLRNLTEETPINKLAVNTAGGLAVLKDLLDSRRLNDAQENHALISALHNLATEEPNRKVMAKNGTLRMLFQALVDLDPTLPTGGVANVLIRLASNAESMTLLMEKESLLRLFQSISASSIDKNVEHILMLLAHLAKQTTSRQALREALLDQNMLPTLLRLSQLSGGGPAARYCITLTGLLTSEPQVEEKSQ